MKIRFNDEGDMEVLIETDLEKEIFPCIERDARVLGEEWLSDSMGPDFDEEWFANWQEWIQPEIQDAYNMQLSAIRKFGKIKDNVAFVPRMFVELWYGAVNQARMALEEIYGFTEENIPEDREEAMSYVVQWSEDKQGAYQRSHFYTWLQEILLEGMIHFPQGGNNRATSNAVGGE